MMTNVIANFESEVPDVHRMLMEEFELVDMGLARGFEEGNIVPERVMRDGLRMAAYHGAYEGRIKQFREAELKVDYFSLPPDRHFGMDWRELQFTVKGHRAAVIGYTAVTGLVQVPRKGQEVGFQSYSAVIHVMQNTRWLSDRS